MTLPANKTGTLRAPAFLTTEQLLETQRKDQVSERARVALLGSFVADAACMGAHWLSAEQIAALLLVRGREYQPEFLDPPAAKKYQYASGSLSALGDEVLPTLQSLLRHGGLYGPHLLAASHKFYTEQTGYRAPLYHSITRGVAAGLHYPWAAVADDQVHALLKAAAADDRALFKVPVICCRYAGKPGLSGKMAAAILAHQDHPTAKAAGAAAALMLERCILGESIPEMLVWASSDSNLERLPQRWVQHALRAQNTPHTEAVQAFGANSSAASCFQGVVHVLACSAGYADAVRKSLLGGGENVGRAMLAGAFFAAQDGIEAVPPQWRQQVTLWEQLQDWAQQLAAQRVIIDLLA